MKSKLTRIMDIIYYKMHMLKRYNLEPNFVIIPISKKPQFYYETSIGLIHDGQLLGPDRVFDLPIIYGIGHDEVEVLTKGPHAN